jgi:hypothetical protein
MLISLNLPDPREECSHPEKPIKMPARRELAPQINGFFV